MNNKLTSLTDYQLKKTDVDLTALDRLTEQYPVSLNVALELISPSQRYFVLHEYSTQQDLNKLYQVGGDSLSFFLRDYIQPNEGDGLDMLVFPEDSTWCLIFEIDGNIIYRK